MARDVIQKQGIGIRARMLIGFSLIILLTAILFITTLISLSNIERYAYGVSSKDLPTLNSLIDFNTQFYKTRADLQNYIMTRNEKYKTNIIQDSEQLNNKRLVVDKLIENLNRNTYEEWQKTQTNYEQLKESQFKIMEAIDKNDTNTAIAIFEKEYDASFRMIESSINQTNANASGILDVQTHKLQVDSNGIIDDLSYLKLLGYVLLAIVILASIGIALYTANKILRPLNNAIDIAQKISTGDRNIEIEITSSDETGILLEALRTMQESIRESEINLKRSEEHTKKLFENVVKSAKSFSDHSSKVASGDLRQRLDISKNKEAEHHHEVMEELGVDLNKMTDNLSSVAKEITQACHSMVTTLDEVRHAVDSQSSGASEQASSINEITASISEIEKSTSQTMEKAKSLGDVAQRTRERGQLGLDAVEQSVQGMKSVRDKVETIAQSILELSNQTQQVGEITSVVNNLAQQSKMLALNASIEAAKAGESGKGFAVVASEVKNLAEQSEQSTEQVQKILEDIKHATEKAVMATEEGTKGVDHGTGLVEQTGEIIRSLNDVIHETSVASQQIEAAVRQESAGIEQITAGMNEINQVTSSFVASVKQTNEAMSNLSKVAKNLQVYVDTYKT